MLGLVRRFLNRHIPFDAIARWWYILIAGAAVGFIFSRTFQFSTLVPKPKLSQVTEGPPSALESVPIILREFWKDDALLVVLGVLIACLVIYLLEEIRRFSRDNR